jgi:hypothetical protein
MPRDLSKSSRSLGSFFSERRRSVPKLRRKRQGQFQ